MELLDFVIVMSILACIVVLVNRVITLADSRSRIELQKRLQKMTPKTSANQRGQQSVSTVQEPVPADVGAWVMDLAQMAGVDPQAIFDDEMPPELARLIPLAKGFLDSGGLQKILAASGKPAEPGPVMQGGPGWEH